jgi:branched-chain amino acid transport system ATP-binding protein
MLSVEGLNVFYGRVQVLREVFVHVGAGEGVTIVGPNGAGKTTLLRAICGLVPLASGTIRFEGREITRWAPEEIVRVGVAMVPEGRELFGALTVRDNLLLGAYSRYRKARARAVVRDLDWIWSLFPHLREREGQLAATLSGGEQQMVAIGRALMARPRLLLLDEPSLGLAPLMIREIFRAIQGLRDEGVTLLLVEQNAKAALKIAQRAYVMEAGGTLGAALDAGQPSYEDVRRAYLGGGRTSTLEPQSAASSP